jgi:hypothetical protein
MKMIDHSNRRDEIIRWLYQQDYACLCWLQETSGYAAIPGMAKWIEIVYLVEALDPEQWQGVTHTHPKQHTRGEHFYTGWLLTFRGQKLVMGARRLQLRAAV